MGMLKCCLNWKALAGLGALAAGILVLRPQLFWSALPTLAVLICPLSMGLMLFGMGKMGGMDNQSQSAQMHQRDVPSGAGTQYTCPMHPEVRADQPGKCPKCGMNLAAVTPPKQALPAGGTMVALSREEELARLRAELDSVREHQEALARQVEELDGAGPAASNRAMREAEQVARR
jgi:hypothetical protein